jgi:hypothetical protein
MSATWSAGRVGWCAFRAEGAVIDQIMADWRIGVQISRKQVGRTILSVTMTDGQDCPS